MSSLYASGQWAELSLRAISFWFLVGAWDAIINRERSAFLHAYILYLRCPNNMLLTHDCWSQGLSGQLQVPIVAPVAVPRVPATLPQSQVVPQAHITVYCCPLSLSDCSLCTGSSEVFTPPGFIS